jgi:hypothetical protein
MEYTQVGLIVVLVAAICEAAKYAKLPSRWVPLLSIVLGLIGAFYFDGFNFLATAAGVVVGLSTSGLYDVVKKTVLNK